MRGKAISAMLFKDKFKQYVFCSLFFESLLRNVNCLILLFSVTCGAMMIILLVISWCYGAEECVSIYWIVLVIPERQHKSDMTTLLFIHS